MKSQDILRFVAYCIKLLLHDTLAYTIHTLQILLGVVLTSAALFVALPQGTSYYAITRAAVLITMALGTFICENARLRIRRSHLRRVVDFTQASGDPIPTRARAFTQAEAEFLAKMILDETLELLVTVHDKDKVKACLKRLLDEAELPRESTHTLADQMDAIVDIEYYMLNAACKNGMNVNRVFKLVHDANMAKRDSATGMFLRRAEDGKIIKPEGWQAPDVEREADKQAVENKMLTG